MASTILRPATHHDLPAILAIHNDVIATSTAIYTEEPSTLEERTGWFEARTGQGFPVLCAVEGDEVAGFASFGPFRPWPCGYAATVEHSVHVRADRRGRGIGSALVRRLLPLARDLGKHVMIGAIDAENEPSLRLHEKLGFARVGHLPEVGRKFDRWLDLVFVQIRL